MKPSQSRTLSALAALVVLLLASAQAVAQQQRPNIVFIRQRRRSVHLGGRC